jgi:hypothetical protein
MEDVGIHMASSSILLPFGIFCGHLVYFSQLWYIVPRKLWQPTSWYDKPYSSF